MRTVSLNDLLTDEQVEAVIDILERGEDSIKTVNALKDYLRPLSEHLEAKGVVPDYLAYVIMALKENALPTLQNN